MKRKKVIQTLFLGMVFSFGVAGSVQADEDTTYFNNSVEIQIQDTKPEQSEADMDAEPEQPDTGVDDEP